MGITIRRPILATHDRLLYVLLAALLVGAAVTGVVADGPNAAVAGLWQLQAHPARLLNDFTSAAGEGAALLNAALVGLIGLGLIRLNGVRLSGPTVAAVFTLFGFGLFGKTPLNILPIMGGVHIAARIARKHFREYILIALFGTALGPLVSLVAVELPLPAPLRVPVAILAGVLAGMALPAAAIVMLRLHQGYNLYNIGLTTGFIALCAAALVFGRVEQLPGGKIWNENPSLLLQALVPIVSIALIVMGLATDRKLAWPSFLRILKLPGRLPSDFMDMESVPGSLLNMGITGLLLWGLVIGVGADLNGPVLGGLFTVIGFASFGKHPRNVWPVVTGVILAALLYGKDLAAPGVILAVLFCTTLVPLAGEFGIIVGILAGFLHLSIVLRSGDWHAGIGLYNNGFAGGLTATLIVALIEWYRANTPETKPARKGSMAAFRKDRA